MAKRAIYEEVQVQNVLFSWYFHKITKTLFPQKENFEKTVSFLKDDDV